MPLSDIKRIINHQIKTLKGKTDISGFQLNRVFNELAEFADGGHIIGSDFSIVGGAVRNTGSGWFLITGGDHDPLNVDNVTNNSQRITIDFSSLGATGVSTFLVNSDEEYAGLYDVGVSVSLGSAAIEIYERQGKKMESLISHTGSGNFTKSGTDITSVSYDNTTGILTITHPSTLNNTPILWNMPSVDAERGNIESSDGSINDITTKVKFFNPDGTQKDLLNPTINRFYFERDLINQERILVDPDTVMGSQANFWFMGIFKVV